MPLHRVYDYEPLERLKRLGLQADAVQRLRGVQANLWTETVESEERAQAGGRKLPGSWGDWPWLEHVRTFFFFSFFEKRGNCTHVSSSILGLSPSRMPTSSMVYSRLVSFSLFKLAIFLIFAVFFFHG